MQNETWDPRIAPGGCDRVRGRLLEYLDAGLPRNELSLDRGHLEACGACRIAAREWVGLEGGVRDATRTEPREVDALVAELAGRVASLSQPLGGMRVPILGTELSPAFLISAVLFVSGIFLLYRWLESPKRADFLIDTEAELRKALGDREGAASDYARVAEACEDALTVQALIELAKDAEHRLRDAAVATDHCSRARRTLERSCTGRTFDRFRRDLDKREQRLRARAAKDEG